MSSDAAEVDTKSSVAQVGPELIIGVVTPVGANTSEFVSRIRGQLATWNYQSSVIRLSSKLGSVAPENEREDERIHRLIEAGNKWCVDHQSKHGLAPLAVEHIQQVREALQESADASGEQGLLQPVPRRAYVIQSLKRPEEVLILRKVYRSAFILFAHQESEQRQEEVLMSHLATHVSASNDELSRRARELIELDANESLEHGQKVRETYALADVFVGEDADPSRGINLLFGDLKLAPTAGEYAMYVAEATAARSLTLSRRVGAVIMRNGSVLATGMNETPDVAGETPDVIAGFDSSEQSKQALAVKIVEYLACKGVLRDESKGRDGRDYKPMKAYRAWKRLADGHGNPDETIKAWSQFEDEATGLLGGSDLSDITEFQRAVHAEMWAVMDAARRGIALEGAVVYCNTYPCHLCWKHLFAVGIKKLCYLKPYRKSRASQMYRSSSKQLIQQFYGIAPRVYRRFFEREIAPYGGTVNAVSTPLIGRVRVQQRDRETALPNVLYASDNSYLTREVELLKPVEVPSTDDP